MNTEKISFRSTSTIKQPEIPFEIKKRSCSGDSCDGGCKIKKDVRGEQYNPRIISSFDGI